ncbi:lytic transglycosylase domain-containing protein [Sphingobium sufflavum]|uniref:transglycosylase SLT domain-containing protein n=1 Tax=Sphingobium sufflavum TaxID=1129547 RepID=UPI001F431533|nr:transglycosylase SLT domain-containing protein [Sphingobium sufflavum]MCE7796549.1 lytic transglycosylase domain-containing protein [Sphingobium sufflavum]
MPSGFETRQPAKQTFAFTGPNPVQVSPSAQGNSRGAQLVGGESRGGVVVGQDAAPMLGPQLGAFFERVLEPHVQRRQQEEYIRGAVTQMGKQAGEEIKSSNGAFSKIFGQSSYVEGAVHYRVQEAVGNWVKETQAKEDDLKKMTDGDRAKYVSDSMAKLTTGDPYTDRLVQGAVFEQIGPVMQTIAKKAYVWGQEEAKASYGGNVATQSDVYQRHAVDADALSDPTDEESAAFVQATNNMRTALIKPHGMDDATYVGSLKGAYRRAAESGNGYVVRLMKASGFLDVLDDKDRTTLEDAEISYAKRAENSLLLSNPALADEYTKLESEARLVKLGHSMPGGVNGLGDRWRAFNDKIKRRTGFDHDMIDADAILGKQMAGLDSAIAGDQRRQDREWQIEDREDAQQFQLDRDAAEDAAENTAATLAWAGGNVRTSVAAGVKEPLINVLANNDYEQGDYSRIVKAYRGDGWVSPLVRDKIRAKVTASIGENYSEATKVAHKEWSALNKHNPAAAMAYYGSLYEQMANFDSIVGAVGPNVAFARAFNNPAQYSTATMPPAERKNAEREIKAAVADMSTWAPWGRTNMNESAQKVVYNAIWRRAAIIARTSPMPMADIVKHVSTTVFASGEVEQYGPVAWENRPNTVPIGRLLGLQPDEADKIVAGAIDSHLKAAGYAKGAFGKSYDIRRLQDPRTNSPAISVFTVNSDRAGVTQVIIPMSELKAAAAANVSARVARGVASAKGVDPYRRIKGESGIDRLSRINREVAAGADPVNHFRNRRDKPGDGHSFRDPVYDKIEATLEKKYGLPSGGMKAIRTKGERSNADQVSSAGARTVYQIIPDTRDRFLKRYGIDAYSSPKAAAEVAALHLRDDYQRTGEWPQAVANYHGGTSRKNHGPKTAAYRARVTR